MPIFEEKQYFRQTIFRWWIDGILFLMFILIAISVWVDDSLTQTSRLTTLAIYLATSLFIGFGFRVVHLRTRVYPDGLRIQYFPFQFREKTVLWSSIQNVTTTAYKPLAEYGGWGIRWNFRTGTRAFTVMGKQGILLEFMDGKYLLIGSQQSEVLLAAINQAKQG